MKYDRFEDLPVWKAAITLADGVYRLTRHRFFAQPGDLRDQLRRASLSVSNNVAEGFERGTTAELLAFLYIARGSAGESRSMLRFSLRLLSPVGEPSQTADRQSEISNPKSEISNLKFEISNSKFEVSDLRSDEIRWLKSEISSLIPLAESCSKQIRGWTDSLQNSDIKGQRHLTDQSRHAYDNHRRAEAFRKLIQSEFRAAHPDLFPPEEEEP